MCVFFCGSLIVQFYLWDFSIFYTPCWVLHSDTTIRKDTFFLQPIFPYRMAFSVSIGLHSLISFNHKSLMQQYITSHKHRFLWHTVFSNGLVWFGNRILTVFLLSYIVGCWTSNAVHSSKDLLWFSPCSSLLHVYIFSFIVNIIVWLLLAPFHIKIMKYNKILWALYCNTVCGLWL